MKFLSIIFSETSVGLAFMVMLLWFINPFGFWMNSMLHMTILGVVIAAFSLLAMFVWKEGCKDEREQLHRFIGARFAYVVAGSLLLFGTVVQAFSRHDIDLWLPTILAAMVFAKILGRQYARKKY